ncbi:hypothetical protein N7489_011958 [Penicillium chrysogenum]|uniref:uncharacterized protein n=1 Tax=Penicillium chrysogenum TaxID=5076 RepID=UPI0024DF197D|nr:uncharacterized protein N7489_011958 [Penicillium chrysogenum]KAJ5231250.1 hypothetical protein N7489_011958 [Penicillium chrysogenum]KAJ6162604.1 hypothetical protein N7497_002583 [Penicillium chrysogenum]
MALGVVISKGGPIDYYVNIIEIEDDNGVYANIWLSFVVDPAGFIRKKGASSAEMLLEEEGNVGSLASECPCGLEDLWVRIFKGR